MKEAVSEPSWQDVQLAMPIFDGEVKFAKRYRLGKLLDTGVDRGCCTVPSMTEGRGDHVQFSFNTS